MKYAVGTKFHSTYIAPGREFEGAPFYGIINRIDVNDVYHISWIYSETIQRDNFDEFYTEEKFEKAMNSMQDQKWTIEAPIQLPEDLFTL